MLRTAALLSVIYIITCNADTTDLPIINGISHDRELLFHVSANNLGHRRFELGCSATGDNIQYSWTKNGKPFEWKSNPDITQSYYDGSLVFLKPKNEDQGLYQCFASNDKGVASSQPVDVKRTYIKLSDVTPVKYSPIKGQPFHLSCPIPESYPKPSINWVRQHATDSAETNTVKDKRITLDPDGTLWFSNVTEEDMSSSYKYTCMATTPARDYEPVSLAEAFIEKVVEGPSPDGQLVEQYTTKDMKAVYGQTTALYCIYGGTPLAHPDWFKDGNNTNNRPGDRVTRYNRSAGKRLLIRYTNYEDSGKYSCIVDNRVGKNQTHTMQLTVEGKPEATHVPKEQTTAFKGEDVKIPCRTVAVPAPEISWTYNAKSLPENDRFVVEADGLTIKNIQESDIGIYGCKASNTHGQIYTETAFRVQ